MACTWFGEICSCCCLTVLLGPAWVLLSKIYKPFAGSLYMYIQVQSFIEVIIFHLSTDKLEKLTKWCQVLSEMPSLEREWVECIYFSPFHSALHLYCSPKDWPTQNVSRGRKKSVQIPPIHATSTATQTEQTATKLRSECLDFRRH